MRTRLVTVPVLAALMGVEQKRSGFRPLDCEGCKWNHAAFGDEFPKSGHCYLFAEAPKVKCVKREQRSA